MSDLKLVIKGVKGIENENHIFDAIGEILREMEDNGQLELMDEYGYDPFRADWAWTILSSDDE